MAPLWMAFLDEGLLVPPQPHLSTHNGPAIVIQLPRHAPPPLQPRYNTPANALPSALFAPIGKPEKHHPHCTVTPIPVPDSQLPHRLSSTADVELVPLRDLQQPPKSPNPSTPKPLHTLAQDRHSPSCQNATSLHSSEFMFGVCR